MGVFKEHAHAFETVERMSKRIYDDAADFGFPYNEQNPPQQIKDLLNMVNDLKGSSLIQSRSVWGVRGSKSIRGCQLKIRIGWEVDEGYERGTQYLISFNRSNSIKRAQPGCDCFITVESSSYSTPAMRRRGYSLNSQD